MSNNLKKLEQYVSFFAHKIKTDIIFKIPVVLVFSHGEGANDNTIL